MNSLTRRDGENGEGAVSGAATLDVEPAKGAADAPPTVPAWEKWRWPIFTAAVLLLGLLIYFPVRHFDFLNFDDDRFVFENPWLANGLTWTSVRWAFLANLTEYSMRAEYWGPITLLSRLADAQLYGMSPGPFHVTSALLHGLNTLLLGLALFRLTGQWKRSAVVALLFLAHPLNVEPVCWLSARKDVVSGTFFICTLLAYANYARRPGGWTYAWLLTAFAAGLMAKPMVITIPFVLLALDWWPLGRIQAARGRREEQLKLLAEKIPLVIMAIAGAILAVLSQQDAGAIGATDKFPIWVRVNNALVAYVTYVRRIFWPSDLAAFYPHRGAALPIWEGAAAFVALVVLTVVAWRLARRRPYAIAGWLWFGVVLGPVIGLVQIGNQALADRYAYPSALGIFIIAVWGIADLLQWRPRAATALAAGAVAACTLCSMRQVSTWRDSITVFTQATAVTEGNSLAYLNLGGAYHAAGNFDKARECYQKCRALRPESALIWVNLGNVERDAGRREAAMEDYNFALWMNPGYKGALIALARTFIFDGKPDAAVSFLLRVIAMDRTDRDGYVILGLLFQQQEKWSDAERVWKAYLRVHPEDDTARLNLTKAQAGIANENRTKAPNP